MSPAAFVQKTLFRLRVVNNPAFTLRKLWWRALGARIGAGTGVPRLEINWPHQVALGRDCILEPDIAFKFAAGWRPGPSILIGDRVFLGRGCEFNICTGIRIGPDSLIASGCKFIDADHGTALAGGR